MNKLYYTLMICSLLLFSMNASAWEACGTDAKGKVANCEYQIIGGTLTIRGVGENGSLGNWYSSTQGDVIQPWKNKGVTNVVVENSIKDIGTYAFKGIASENSVKIPSGVTEIKPYSFFNCEISEIIIPETVTVIQDRSFLWSSMQKVDIPNSVQEIGSMAFRATGLVDVVIPDSVLTIGDGAFSYCTSLQSLTVGENTILGNIFDYSGENHRVTDITNLKIYCTGDTKKCDENLKNAGYENLKSTAVTAKKVNGVTYIMDKKGNIVASSGERLNKRIYTMEEATTVAGQKNKVMIRYK